MDGVLRVLDLFSGIGGFSYGLEMAGGYETVAFCEIDPFCREVLRKHWPEVPCFEDITKTDFSGIKADIITAGFPCQDISNAGKRAGLAGERSGLFWEVVRAIRVVRPQYVLLENVAALLHRGMGEVLEGLAGVGYNAEWDCLPAGAFGFPHIRNRIFVVAHSNNETQPVKSFHVKEWTWVQKSNKRKEILLQEPIVGGVDDGIPYRLDRLRSLGNSVVPQVVCEIGKAINRCKSGGILI